MNLSQVSPLKMFSQPLQYLVPIFQRGYVWSIDKKQVTTLWSDIADRAEQVARYHELLEQAKTTRLMFMVFMGLVAAISLLVGGIGIMNIMLATVTERTREIGIRRALGAKQADIVLQFLVEAAVLSVVGGVVGILAGLFCTPVVIQAKWFASEYYPTIFKSLPEVVRNLTPAIVPESIPIAFFISIFIGIVFGLFPAIRAAKMNPIDALRHSN